MEKALTQFHFWGAPVSLAGGIARETLGGHESAYYAIAAVCSLDTDQDLAPLHNRPLLKRALIGRPFARLRAYGREHVMCL